ncbi:MAG: folate-binding protein [Rhodoferax sp.]|uniref:CAF17-like 4Fe-4S cluster assembly/insertion protein YgfZ n=1 Tax=Rhodoferax sp. TaxID=50421 RepID=UPI00271DE368|nr:folate-binding protein [Rhodoferax sp.]MDO8450006.1 folate-binding protein [Rhodoferax sp.]
MKIELKGVAPLSHLGVIRVEGEDAAKFLHGQLTQDFSLLGLSEARLAAFCSAKGRMQASFIGFKRSHTEILLVCSRDILATTLKRLSMFVLRAKARLTDASSDYALFGLAGDAIESIAGDAQSAWAKTDIGNATVVNLYPADGVRRALWLAPVAETAPAGQALSTQDWCWGEVRSGIAMITAPIVEAFVPQMLNYESVGGVNFKKGCYPGQEVVARSQFRGTLKRRAFSAHSDAPMKAGDEVFQADDDTQPCGIVAQAAQSPSGGFDAIVSAQVSAVEAGGLHLGAASGAAVVVAPPPYPLLADI